MSTPNASVNSELNVKRSFTMSKLRSIIAEGLVDDNPKIIIPPGIYRGNPEDGKDAHIVIRDAKNCQIIANGVIMICTSMERAITINNSRNVELQGITIDYDPLPFTQGDIVAIDSINGWLDVRIHAGYPVRAQARIDIVDRQTRYRRMGKPFMWQSSAKVIDKDVVRVTNREAAKFARVGDLASMSMDLPPHTPHTISVETSERVTLRGVTVYASNCMGFVLSGGAGDHRIEGCRIVPGPMPVGATEPRLLSTNADAILTSSLGKGVLTENCEIRDAGDDTWSVQSDDYRILGIHGTTILLGRRGRSPITVGSRIKSGLDSPEYSVTSMRSVRFDDADIDAAVKEQIIASKSGYWHLFEHPDKSWITELELDSVPQWKVGESVIDIDHQGNGFVFRNNRIRSSGRILIKASGLIEGNDIDQSQGIIIRPEITAPGAIGVGEVIVRRNIIKESHHRTPSSNRMQAGAICVAAEGQKNTPRPDKCFGRIIIEGNTIVGGNGIAIAVSSTKEVVIRTNHIISPQQCSPSQDGKQFGIDNHAICWLANCNKVSFSNNVVTNPGSYLSIPLVLGPKVEFVEGVFPTKTETQKIQLK
ncbi:MAG: right-handed parallel beta-helix repeat-containing protein [Bacteroidales bacterium]